VEEQYSRKSHPHFSKEAGRGLKIKLALAQLESTPASPKQNLEKIRETIASTKADLYIFPELFLTGYYLKDLHYRYALSLDSPEIEEVKRIACRHDVGIIVGFAEKTSYGFLYNSALATSCENTMIFRKRHLPTFAVFEESRWFRPYRGKFTLWNFQGVGVGVAICYDIFFPEIFRTYTLQGAQLLVVISATPDQSIPLFKTMVRARALENTTYTAWVNMVGVFDGLGFGGASLLADPIGNIVLELKKYREDVQVAEIDLTKTSTIRLRRPIIRDCHIEDALQLIEAYKKFENMT